MGGKSSTEIALEKKVAYLQGQIAGLKSKPHVIYQTDPKILKQLQQLKKNQNPKAAVELVINNLRSYKFPRSQNGRKIIFVGKTSVGKTSLINTLFQKSQPTSKKRCTKEIKLIGEYGNIHIYDSPGYDADFNIIDNPDLIPVFLGEMDQIYFLYDGVFDQNMIKAFIAMGKDVVGVRTKCDPQQAEQGDQQTKAEETLKLKQLGIQQPLVFFTSKIIPQETDDYLNDNGKLLEHILRK